MTSKKELARPAEAQQQQHTMLVHTIDRMMVAWPGTPTGRLRFSAVSMSLALKDPKLAPCSMASKLVALNECCKLGLIPDRHLGHVWLVPFANKVTVIIGYKGFVELAHRSGVIKAVNTAVVHANDRFVFQQGTQPILQHSYWWQGNKPEPGPVTCVWGTAQLSNSSMLQIEVMHVDEINKIRARSKASKEGPWVTDWEMMARKTVLRRMAKLWPLSPELGRAMSLDTQAEAGQPQDLDHVLGDGTEIHATDPAEETMSLGDGGEEDK